MDQRFVLGAAASGARRLTVKGFRVNDDDVNGRITEITPCAFGAERGEV